MSTRRRAPNKDERIAACLLMLKRGEEWLIPEPIRSSGTAKEILAVVQWDHAFLHAMGGDTRPQNITPLRVAEHKEKSKKDNGVAAKSKRLIAKQEAFRQRLLAKDEAAETKKSQAPKRKIASGAKLQSRNNLTKAARAEARERMGR
jgi:hypothetical protein